MALMCRGPKEEIPLPVIKMEWVIIPVCLQIPFLEEEGETELPKAFVPSSTAGGALLCTHRCLHTLIGVPAAGAEFLGKLSPRKERRERELV